MKKKKESEIPLLKRLLGYIAPFRARVIFTLLFSLVSVALTLYIPIIIGNAVDCIPGLVDGVSGVKGKFAEYLVEIGIMTLAAALFQWLSSALANRLTFDVVKNLRIETFAHLQTLPLSAIDRTPRGDYITRMITDIDKISDGLLQAMTQLFSGTLTIIGTLILMFRLNVWISLFVMVVTPLSVFVAKFIAQNVFSYFKKQSEADGNLSAHTEEMLSGMDAVKAFAYEDEAIRKFDEKNAIFRKLGVKATFFSSLTNPTSRFINGLAFAGVAVLGSIAVMKNPAFTVGILSTFLTYANQYSKPFNEISGVLAEVEGALASSSRVFELLDKPSEKELEGAGDVPAGDGRVTAENVSFSYIPDTSLIENLNFDIKRGMKIAVVGPTGCGKTTIINLLMRFYDVKSGTIKLNGKDVMKISRNNLRSHYGMVLQDSWLKHATVRENIALGKPNATDAEIETAAKAASAHGFILRLPEGYDTVIEEDGANLSAGQKQLLCIARVMLAIPEILILDEATSSIDTMTEMRIQRAFSKMTAGRTSFIVAHRLSTIREADCILVMKKGKVIEQGTHRELLDAGGFYSELYYSQFDSVMSD